MKIICKVLDVFKTSVGEVVILAFFDSTIPSVGRILSNESGEKWKIVRQGMNKKETYIDDEDVYTSIWDCKIEPIDSNSLTIKEGDLLSLI